VSDADGDAVADSDATGENRGVAANLGASASLSFDTADATDAAVHARTVGDDVGVELAVDLGAVRTEVVLDADATHDLIDDLRECRDGLAEDRDALAEDRDRRDAVGE
jgi:hypothetical protein